MQPAIRRRQKQGSAADYVYSFCATPLSHIVPSGAGPGGRSSEKGCRVFGGLSRQDTQSKQTLTREVQSCGPVRNNTLSNDIALMPSVLPVHVPQRCSLQHFLLIRLPVLPGRARFTLRLD